MKKQKLKAIEELTSEIEQTQKKIQQAENRKKILDRRIALEKRKERNHRLCLRGGYIESVVPELINMTDEDAKAFLYCAITSPEARNFLKKRGETDTIE